MKAKSRDQYTQAWQSQVNQFIHVFLDAGAPINDWEQTKADLYEVIEDAANNIFPST